MALNLDKARKCLANFDFAKLFIEELGWSQPPSRQSVPMDCKGVTFTRRQIAQLAGVVVFEIAAQDGQIPEAKLRAAVHKEVSSLHHENLLIFVDGRRTQSLWYWAKRQDGKTSARDHIYVRGQPGDLFLGKLNAMVFDISDFDEAGNVPLVEVTDRLKDALDIERVTKKFYDEFQAQHLEFLELITGIADERDRKWYASVLLNRLMFVYFLQKKFFLDGGNDRYLQDKLEQSRKKGLDLYYEKFLKTLFFEGFAKPEDKRSAKDNALLGKIKYLNGGLFLKHRIEMAWPNIEISDEAFVNLFALFDSYSWNLNDTPGGQDNEINPDVLGYIFEKYINQKAFGAYYTRPQITEYLCERTIHRLILDGVAKGEGKGARAFENIGDLLLALDAPLCKKLLNEVLPNLRLLDPACGSAAFLVSAMKTLINIYSAVIGKIEFLGDRGLKEWLQKTQKEHKSVSYFIKRSIITNNLFGVDIMEEAIEIAKLRLFLALVASATSVDDLEPLPNIEFNIMAGNSLIGLLKIDAKDFDKYSHDLSATAFFKDYQEVLREKNELVGLYRRATAYAEDIQSLRDGIEAKKQKAVATLNRLLLELFNDLGIKYEQATWDEKKCKEGKPLKRGVKEDDIVALKPFHWGFEFDEIINKRGGFDAIITNPPWEIFKPNSKEFMEEFSDLVSKKKMTIKEFEKEQAKLLKDPDIRDAWLKYLSEYPHVSAFYRSAPQYKNQISIVDGKKAGSDINLYKLFLEQCHNLLREGGRCGIIIPSGVYTDLGTKQLREMLFGACEVDALFGLSNEKFIFEGVHHAFKLCILSFAKGGSTKQFRSAFRINPREAVGSEQLDDLFHTYSEHLSVSVDLVRRLAPDSLSVMEFKNPTDVQIANKMLEMPLLGSTEEAYPVILAREFDMSQPGGTRFVRQEKSAGVVPLYEGKMIWQFMHDYAEPQYWVKASELNKFLYGEAKNDRPSDFYRLVFRRQSACTNERTLVSTIIPPGFHADNLAHLLPVDQTGVRTVKDSYAVALCALFNSFVADYSLRQRVTNNINFFFIYQIPSPRLTENDTAFSAIVKRAARLICTTPDFDDLAKEVGLNSHKDGVKDALERGKLRAELDGMIAHLYGLTEEEFAYILTTFPLVPDPVKIAAQNAFRNVEKGLIK